MRFLFLLGLALLALAAGAVDTAGSPRPAPQFLLPDLDHNRHSLADYAGRVLVVNFWASWCVPCREELPSMNRAARMLRTQPIVWLAVNVGEDADAVAAFRNDYPIAFPVLLDRNAEVSKNWQVSGLPTTIVINRQGQMAHRITGKREWDDGKHLRMLLELIKAPKRAASAAAAND